MKTKVTNYRKPDVLRLFRSWADLDSTWEHHVSKLAAIACPGKLPPVDPDFPHKPRHAAIGTSLDKRDLRHALRDICRGVALMKTVSNQQMDQAYSDRVQCEKLFLDFADPRTCEGDFFVQKKKLEHIRDAATREHKAAILEAERRRRSTVCDGASREFARMEDERAPYDRACRDFPAAFAGYKPWVRPDVVPQVDEKNPTLVAIDAIDWDSIVFSEERAYFIDSLASTLVGHLKHGPLMFSSKEAAEQFIEDHPKFALAQTRLAAEPVRSRLEWYSGRHTFYPELPPGGQWLFVVYPDLLVAAPPEPEAFQTELDAIKEPEPLEW